MKNNTVLKTLKAAWLVVLNKAFAVGTFAALMVTYASIPPVTYDAAGNRTGGMPFAELLFVAVMISGVFATVPFVRLLFFPEAARYAEGRGLTVDLAMGQKTLNYSHYRMATIISFAVTVAIFATLAH